MWKDLLLSHLGIENPVSQNDAWLNTFKLRTLFVNILKTLYTPFYVDFTV